MGPKSPDPVESEVTGDLGPQADPDLTQTSKPHKMSQRPYTTLPRRDRNPRGPFVHFDIYEHPYDTLRFEDLHVDPRARHFVDTRFLHNFDRQPYLNRRVTEIGRPQRGNAMEQRRESVHDRSRLPFGRAMTKLHDQVDRALTFYNTTMTEFNDIANPTMKLATEDAIVQMWWNYLEGKRDEKLEYNDPNDDGSFREMKGLCADMRKDLTETLRVALDADWRIDRKGSRKSEARCQDARRLQKKIEVARDEILDSLKKLGGGREHCAALLAELEELKERLDPEKEINKVLFKALADDVDDNASMAGNDGQERV